MAINQLPSKQVALLPEMSNPDIEKTVQTVIGSLKCNARDFEHAKLTYNSDFFLDESADFKRALCLALNTFFGPVGTSLFWKKQAGV